MNSHTDLISLLQEFQNEVKDSYLNCEEERAPYRLRLDNNGQLYNAYGELITLTKLLFVISKDNLLYGAPFSPEWSHSFFLAGEPVKAAGMLETDEEGVLFLISNESGHYCPTLVAMMPALLYFLDILFNMSLLDIECLKFDNHEQAGISGIITSYRVNNLITIFDYNTNSFNENLDEYVVDQFDKNSSTDNYSSEKSATPPEGYALELNGSPSVLEFGIFSRYGLKPRIQENMAEENMNTNMRFSSSSDEA